jgi:hypothetical protein
MEEKRKVMSDAPTATAIVARGRTVHAPTGQKRVIGYDAVLRTEIYCPFLEMYGPGSEVTLPVTEIARLRALGFLAA